MARAARGAVAPEPGAVDSHPPRSFPVLGSGPLPAPTGRNLGSGFGGGRQRSLHCPGGASFRPQSGSDNYKDLALRCLPLASAWPPSRTPTCRCLMGSPSPCSCTPRLQARQKERSSISGQLGSTAFLLSACQLLPRGGDTQLLAGTPRRRGRWVSERSWKAMNRAPPHMPPILNSWVPAQGLLSRIAMLQPWIDCSMPLGAALVGAV